MFKLTTFPEAGSYFRFSNRRFSLAIFVPVPKKVLGNEIFSFAATIRG